MLFIIIIDRISVGDIMKIYIDGDGCPVVDITIKVAKEYKLPCTIITDTSHIFNKEYADTITVEKGADSADFKIANLIEKSDIVVTQDYGLGAMCLSRGSKPINQNGLIYTDKNRRRGKHGNQTVGIFSCSGGRGNGEWCCESS